jgi:hypothetical protein
MLKRIQCETWCTNANLTGNFDENTSFTYGNNIATQAQPVKYNTISASFELYGSDGSDYESLKQVWQW